MVSSRRADASMYVYKGVTATTINTASEYHGVEVLGTGPTLDGVTFTAGANGAITDTADNGGVLRVTDVAHGLTTGQYVTLNGMDDALHDGITRVTVIGADTFDCDNIVYNSDNDIGFWQRGSSLTVDAGFGGSYAVDWSASCSSAANNKNFKFECYKGITPLDEFVGERKISIQGDLGCMSSGGTASLIGGDVVWLAVEGTTDDTNLTIKHGNVHIHKQ